MSEASNGHSSEPLDRLPLRGQENKRPGPAEDGGSPFVKRLRADDIDSPKRAINTPLVETSTPTTRSMTKAQRTGKENFTNYSVLAGTIPKTLTRSQTRSETRGRLNRASSSSSISRGRAAAVKALEAAGNGRNSTKTSTTGRARGGRIKHIRSRHRPGYGRVARSLGTRTAGRGAARDIFRADNRTNDSKSSLTIVSSEYSIGPSSSLTGRAQPNNGQRVHRVVKCGYREDGTVCQCISRSNKISVATGSVDSVETESDWTEDDTSYDECSDEFSDTESSSDELTNNPYVFLSPQNGQRRNQNSERRRSFFHNATEIDEDLEMHSTPSSRLHRCSWSCPIGCRGSTRPSEIIIYEGIHVDRLVKADLKVSVENPICLDLRRFNTYRRVGGKSSKESQVQTTFRRRIHRQHFQGFPDMPQRVQLLYDEPQVSRGEALKHAWNQHDRSFNVTIKESDPFTIRRQPVAQSTDSARTLQGYSSGLHMFQVTWPLNQRGTHSSVGVSTNRETLHSIGYSSLVGLTEESWGWDLGRLKAYHKSCALAGSPYPETAPPDFEVLKTFFLVLDCDAGTLGFISDGKWLGVSHQGLQNKVLYPTVSGVWGHCEVTLRYHGGLDQKVSSLSELSRAAVRRRCTIFNTLPIPRAVKKFLDYQ